MHRHSSGSDNIEPDGRGWHSALLAVSNDWPDHQVGKDFSPRTEKKSKSRLKGILVSLPYRHFITTYQYFILNFIATSLLHAIAARGKAR